MASFGKYNFTSSNLIKINCSNNILLLWYYNLLANTSNDIFLFVDSTIIFRTKANTEYLFLPCKNYYITNQSKEQYFKNIQTDYEKIEKETIVKDNWSIIETTHVHD